MGEHDLTGTDDGPHQDILVASATKHPNAVNDVGIIHLERDVGFSGENRNQFFLVEFVINLNILIFWTDTIRPVCLPVDKPYQSREFVDANAFVAGSTLLISHKMHRAHNLQSIYKL